MWITSVGKHGAAGVSQNAGVLFEIFMTIIYVLNYTLGFL